MAKDCENTFLIHQSGTAQTQRFQSYLTPENLNLNDFSVEDWMKFAYNFAKEVNYFKIDDATNPDGNWESFFIEKDKIATFLKNVETSNELTPHLTLFLCFLNLLEISKSRFNSITKSHLDFYYGKILQIDNTAAIADKVHLIFELAKNTSETKVEKNTSAEAGKDSEGKKLQYKTTEESVINKTKVSSLRSVYHHRVANNSLNLKKKSTQRNGLFAAPVANSGDGLGEAFKESPKWLPFGYPAHQNPDAVLPTPNLGFAIAAPLLLLQEGNREIKINFEFKKPVSISVDPKKLSDAIECYATGEEGWLGSIASANLKVTISGKNIVFTLSIDKTEGAIIAYNQKLHAENFKTNQPLLRFNLKTQLPTFAEGYTFYTEMLEKELKKLTVSVDVSEVTSLQLKNDFGEIAADKPFFPFGTQPVKRSSFYIDYPEMFDKNWDSATIEAAWLNTPASFATHYSEYKNAANVALVPNDSYFKAKLLIKEKGTYKDTPNSSYSVSMGANVSTVVSDQIELFQSIDSRFKAKFKIEDKVETANAEGPLKLQLSTSFLHDLFPNVYAKALTAATIGTLPNAPYTPIVESIQLSYKAHQNIEFGGTLTPNQEKIQLFHIHPFGQAENTKTLVPTYCAGGELYIGLVESQALQNVSLLFQILEGTENPLTEPLTPSEEIKWAILSNNQWMKLDSTYLLGNTTDNFLKTGIVTVTIPREANNDNTLLPPGQVWLRAKSLKNFDAVCQFIDIHAQVITAEFFDNFNELSHLSTGLPAGTISKLTERNATIKGITQPYSSFGGTPKESDPNYYQRVSERIRHRDRAITLWDYEHLILEQFKDIHKVKCLNTTKDSNYHVPGAVSLVVIPDIINKNAFDIFQPRVSTAQRNEIQNYINNLNSFFVTANVINPDYEEVDVALGVKFNDGFDANFYTKQLEEDIKKYLAPWAYKEVSQLNFGVTFHKSKLISYLEQKPYVDYLDNVVINHTINLANKKLDQVNIIPTSPKAILVSAKKHIIKAIQSSCGTKIINTPAKCLP